MNRTPIVAALAAFAFHNGAVGAEPAFEVAAIHPCPSGTQPPEMEHTGITNFVSPGGRFTARATTVVFLMEWAYGIPPWQHSNGPGWLESDRFDILAKAGHEAAENEMKQMARTLLADRFGLRLHVESRELTAYVISVGKSAPKLFPPKDGEAHGMQFAPVKGPDQNTMTFHINATRFSLPQLADVFARRLDRIVLNGTGMEGEYNFSLDLTPDESRPSPMDQSLFLAALRQQIGLNVESQKAAVDFYVIDSAEKATGN